MPVGAAHGGAEGDRFGAAIGRFEALAKQGRIHGHREFFGVTGGYGGSMIADGTDQTIQELMGDYTRDMQEVGLL